MDAIKLIIVFLIFIVPWALAGLWWWVGFWLVIAAVLGLGELVCYLVTGKTLSQLFWKWKTGASTKMKLLILGGMVVFWGYLIAHLFLGW